MVITKIMKGYILSFGLAIPLSLSVHKSIKFSTTQTVINKTITITKHTQKNFYGMINNLDMYWSLLQKNIARDKKEDQKQSVIKSKLENKIDAKIENADKVYSCFELAQKIISFLA